MNTDQQVTARCNGYLYRPTGDRLCRAARREKEKRHQMTRISEERDSEILL